MELARVLIRWLHVVGALSLVGVFASLIFVVRPAVRAAGAAGRERLSDLDGRLLRIAQCALAVTLGAGLLDLWRQVAMATGVDWEGALAWDHILPVLVDTRYGTIWLARAGLLAVLATLLLLADEESERDWLALRLQGLGLAAASLVLGGTGGHAAAAGSALGVGLDGAHLLASGVWAGGLVPLALCLAWAGRLPHQGPVATAAAAEGFSRLGLGAVATLAVSGAFATWQQVGSVPALIGTTYGRWLLVKLGLFAALIPLAARNLLVSRGRLATPGLGALETATLRRQVLAEAGLVGAILVVVAVLGLTAPARHSDISWPLSFRFDWEATKTVPGAQPQVAIGSQVATLGLVALLLALMIRPRRWRLAALGGGAGLALGATVALHPLAVDANPTTYLRPAVPYSATSIVQGEALYRAHCRSCHGVAGTGDGPAGAALPRRPADLTAQHASDHTAGDLYWWVSHGIMSSGMPGFGDRLTPEDRWDVINFVRALGASERGRDLGPVISPRPVAVAPDFTFTTGIGTGRALKDWRGRGVVLLVFFTLPGSAERLAALDRLTLTLRLGGGEVLGVPLGDPDGLYRALGGRPVFFPLVVDGAAEAARAYMLFRRDLTLEGQRPEPPPATHMELLVDRQGYLRARWIPRDVTKATEGWADTTRLLAEIDRLAREAPATTIAAEHVH